MIRMNRMVPIIGGAVLLIAIGVALRSGERRPRPEMMGEVPQAPGPDVDTPADTVRSLSAQVAELVDQTRHLTEENRRLREQNVAAADQEQRVTERVRAALAGDIERAGRRDESTLSALSQQLERLRSRLARTPPSEAPAAPGGMPVGFGYGSEGRGDAIHWIDGLDATPSGPDGGPDPFVQPVAAGPSLLHPGTPPGPTDGSTLKQMSAGKAGAVAQAKATRRPAYTIPANATLTRSTLFTALVGRVPVGGQVRDPMPFKVLVGADNLAANGLRVPDLEGMVMSGVAVGDWTLSCVRGTITSATFVFQDGRVQTFGGQRDRNRRGEGRSEGLGWISDRFGVPCVSGERITNAPAFLTQRIGIMALAAAAEAAAASQTTSTVSDRGTANTTVTGDQGRYVLGRTVSGGAHEVDAWLTEREARSFDAVFVAAGAPVVVHLDVTLPIDYDPAGRRLDYHAGLAGPGGAYGQLD